MGEKKSSKWRGRGRQSILLQMGTFNIHSLMFLKSDLTVRIVI